jgi:acyl carrier protein
MGGTNYEKLMTLLSDIFLIDPSELRADMKRSEIDTWDSLGTVSMAVGIQEAFGYHMSPDEAMAIDSIRRIIDLLKAKGIDLDE